jgi:Phage baseplate assembly protein W
MSINRGDRFTITDKQIEYYTDFMNDFELNPITGLLAKVSNEDSIKQSLKNLVLTKRTERFYKSFIGSRIEAMLFDPMDEVTQSAIQDEIRETILNNEPRVKLIEVLALPNQDANQYDVTITFQILNKIADPVTLNLALKRVR